ncbi:MFS transporter [Kutzneria kofuensis]|uniref:Putative MFS family arabinose efflux permease n=1 Tax=Kutzneria kofuensis TaxID=103725 RepID=A0A7W9KEW8_9PSEU|nr:MFS transporter [Kutzneria kofuensis]MBB5891160.1 putative MFS family arabinose efflux permease [Kutzneria kofuensis]
MSDILIRRAAAMLGGFVVGACVFSIAGLMPSLTIELDVSDAESAQLVTVFGLAGALALPLIGRIDPRRLPLIGLVVLAIGNGLSVFAEHFVPLLTSRIVLGIGAACVVRAGGRGWAGGLAVGVALGAPLAAVIADQAGYRTVFVLLAVLAAIGAADALLGVPMSTIDRHPIGDPRVLLTAGLKVIFRVGLFAVFTLLTSVLAAVEGIHGPAVDALFLAFGLGLVTGVLGGRGRGTRAVLLASGALSAALAAALPLLHGSMAGTAVVLACWGASAGAADAAMRGVIADPVLDETAGFLGVGLSGLVGGAVLGTAGPDALPQVAAGLTVVVVITAMVGLTSSSRREGHRGPGALSTGSQDAR